MYYLQKCKINIKIYFLDTNNQSHETFHEGKRYFRWQRNLSAWDKAFCEICLKGFIEVCIFALLGQI